MAKCKKCGRDLSVYDDTIQGACYDCHYNVKAKENGSSHLSDSIFLIYPSLSAINC